MGYTMSEDRLVFKHFQFPVAVRSGPRNLPQEIHIRRRHLLAY